MVSPSKVRNLTTGQVSDVELEALSLGGGILIYNLGKVHSLISLLPFMDMTIDTEMMVVNLI